MLFYPPEDAWPETQAFFEETKAGLASLGLTAEIVSTGGTRAPSQLELAERFRADGHEVRCIASQNVRE